MGEGSTSQCARLRSVMGLPRSNVFHRTKSLTFQVKLYSTPTAFALRVRRAAIGPVGHLPLAREHGPTVFAQQRQVAALGSANLSHLDARLHEWQVGARGQQVIEARSNVAGKFPFGNLRHSEASIE